MPEPAFINYATEKKELNILRVLDTSMITILLLTVSTMVKCILFQNLYMHTDKLDKAYIQA